MTTRGLALGLVGLLVMGCSAAGGPTAATNTSGTGGGATPAGGNVSAEPGGGGGSAADGAAAVTDACNVMPAELVRTYVPKAADPVTDSAAHSCTMSDGTSAVQVTLQSGFGPPDPPVPGEAVDNLGEHAWVQEQTVDDAYLVIDLGTDASGGYRSMYVEYAGHDGKGHRNDAIAIANAVLEALR